MVPCWETKKRGSPGSTLVPLLPVSPLLVDEKEEVQVCYQPPAGVVPVGWARKGKSWVFSTLRPVWPLPAGTEGAFF